MLLTDADFNIFVKEEAVLPVLVFFGAEWCGPTIAMFETINEVEEDMADVIALARVRVDESPVTSQIYGIRGTPTVILFRNGEPLGNLVGTLTVEQLTNWVVETLAPKPEKRKRTKKVDS